MLSPRGQAGLEAEILSTDSVGLEEWPRPRAYVLGMFSNILFWPREMSVGLMMKLVLTVSL